MAAPIPINPGDTFGRLTVMRLTDQRQDGDRLWECRCSCGKIKLAKAINLKLGRVKSCGCYRAERSARHLPSKTKTKARYKESAVHTDTDGDWYALRHSAKYLGVGKSAIQTWRRHSDDLGRGILTRKFEENGELKDYDAKADLDAIKAARTELSPKPAAETTVDWAKAVEMVGACRTTIGDRIEAESLPGKRGDGQPCQRTRLDKDKVAQLAKFRRALTIPQVAEYCGVDRSVIENRITKRLVLLLPNPWGYLRGGVRIEKAEAEKLKAELDVEEEPATEQDGYRWLPMQMALCRYPNATRKVLEKYANEKCPQRKGGILHARRFPREALGRAGGGRYKTILKWREDCLQDLEPAKVGKPGQEAAALARHNNGAKNGPHKDAKNGPSMLPEVTTAELGWKAIGQLQTLLTRISHGEIIWLSVAEAATVISCSEQRIIELVGEERLRDNGRRGRNRRINAADAARYRVGHARPQTSNGDRETEGPPTNSNPERPTIHQCRQKLLEKHRPE